jgi:hypothetical protein
LPNDIQTSDISINENEPQNVHEEFEPKDNTDKFDIVHSDLSASKIATTILKQDGPEKMKMLEALQAELVIESEFDWFFLLSNAIDNDFCSPWVAEVIQLGTQYQPGFTRSESRLKELFEHLEEVNVSWAMALLAGTIRPCLMILTSIHRTLYPLLAKNLISFPQCQTLPTNWLSTHIEESIGCRIYSRPEYHI